MANEQVVADKSEKCRDKAEMMRSECEDLGGGRTSLCKWEVRVRGGAGLDMHTIALWGGFLCCLNPAPLRAGRTSNENQ